MDEIPLKIGNYKILKKIGQGGMGEIFLAFDPACQRQVALKCMRSDIEISDKVREQFLHEAVLTSQLTHPGIIPIYSIVEEKDRVFFTMPFIEGKTLKELFDEARQRELADASPNSAYSVAVFSYMFLQICSAVAYAHSKGIIHRDLKPSNILVGANHEVRILDWGLIEAVAAEKKYDPEGKISGTVVYLAPELVYGQQPSYQSEIYTLGLIFYQMLTLRYPFHRSYLNEYADNMQKEVLIDPAKVAPHRDIPPILSNIALKCLTVEPQNRYQSVNEIISDLEKYLEGQSEWIKFVQLHLDNKSEWTIRKNVKYAEFADSTIFISKASFVDDVKIEAEISIATEGNGVGFLFNADTGGNFDCIWFSSDPQTATKLFRNQKLVMEFPQVILQRDEHYQVRIEKVKNNLYVYLNNVLQFNSMGYLPQMGSHLGILKSDPHCSIIKFDIFVAAKNLRGSHLAAADALLAYKEYDKALNEYRRVAQALPETGEGREALFRAGIALFEESQNCHEVDKSRCKMDAALQEFAKLHGSAGAPLEYLGRVLVYEWLQDTDKEIKAFEYALQNFSHHPLVRTLGDQLIYRIHDCNQKDSPEFYPLALLAIRYLPFDLIQLILPLVDQKLKPIYFLDDIDISTEKFQRMKACVALGFYLAKPQKVAEMIDEILRAPSHLQLIESALIALIELNASELAQQKLDMLLQMQLDVQAAAHFGWIHQLICASNGNFEDIPVAFLAELPRKLEKQHMHFVLCLLNLASRQKKASFIRDTVDYLMQFDLSAEQQSQLIK